LRNRTVAFILATGWLPIKDQLFMRRDVFQAIADPTRREIISVIASRSITLSGVTDAFDISRQAISKHIRILTECGLVVIRPQGRERYCEARLDKLNDVSNWLEPLQKVWEHRFEKLDLLLTDMRKKNKKKTKKP
jgi:DNA-binding transcriptional ArsR family regulator